MTLDKTDQMEGIIPTDLHRLKGIHILNLRTIKSFWLEGTLKIIESDHHFRKKRTY